MIGSNIKRSISIKKSTIGEITADHALLLWYELLQIGNAMLGLLQTRFTFLTYAMIKYNYSILLIILLYHKRY